MITAEQLQLHADWLRDSSGKRIEAIGANLIGANLSHANLVNANFRNANFRNANLVGADLRDANLVNASLSGASLSGASLWGANLWGANLRGADLSNASLIDADLIGADLRGTSLRYAIGNMREIKSAQFDQWVVAWSADVLAIGCQQHAIEEWRNADPRWIEAMDNGASDWWSRYGALVLQLIDASPATGKVLEVVA